MKNYNWGVCEAYTYMHIDIGKIKYKYNSLKIIIY